VHTREVSAPLQTVHRDSRVYWFPSVKNALLSLLQAHRPPLRPPPAALLPLGPLIDWSKIDHTPPPAPSAAAGGPRIAAPGVPGFLAQKQKRVMNTRYVHLFDPFVPDAVLQ